MRRWSLITAAALVLGAAACDGGTPFQVVSGRSGTVTLSVSDGSTPNYSWSGGRARSLTVLSASGEVFWQVEALSPTEGFSPPVRHGVTPVGARLVTAARPLQPGVVHTATVIEVTGGQGVRTFTPSAPGATP